MTPDKIVEMNGVRVNQKIIPDGTRWKDGNKARNAGFQAGDLYKAQVKMTKVNTVTVHNTNDLDNIEDDAERYILATFLENMGSTRPFAYTDDKSTWQLLKMDEVNWCNGRGTYNTGAIDDIAIECVMGEDVVSDEKAEDNAARLAAYLLHEHNLGIDALRTHTYWINLGLGIKGNIDYMNTYRHPKAPKYCPYYILPHWAKFKALVQKYLDELNKPQEMYRVRKSWSDVKSQIGAFTNLESAKVLADKNIGYEVYNNEGKIVYKPSIYADYIVNASRAFCKTVPTANAKIVMYLDKGTIVKVYKGVQSTVNGVVYARCIYQKKVLWIPLKYLKLV